MNKINPIYQYNVKQSKETINHNEWNNLSQSLHIAHDKINNIIDNIVFNDIFSLNLSNQNTMYIINESFDLNNESLTIPNNCILKFEKGGSISNGTVILQNTKLEGDIKWNNVTISGSCINDILTPQMFGAYPSIDKNESNKTQHTLAFKNLINVINNQNTLSKLIYISSGHYSINDEINFTTSCKFYGDGNTSIIDLYDGKGTIIFGERKSNQFITCTKLNITISEDVNKFDKKIVVTDTEGLNAGDYLILCDTKDGSFNNSRVYYRTCECVKIKSISEYNVYLDDIIYGYYFSNFGENYVTTFSPAPAYRTVIHKFVPKTFNISDIKIISHEHEDLGSRQYYSFVVRGFHNSEFNNITIENYGNDVAATIGLGLNYKVNHCIFRSYTTYTSDAYGLMVSTSQNYIISNSTFRANSHALATGSNGTYVAIQSRKFIYENLYFETSEKINYNLEDEYRFIDLDIHATAEYYKLLNIIAPQTTCDTGGYNVTVEGCKFYAISPTFNMGDYTLRGCEIFGPSYNMLFSNVHRENDNGNNSIFIENCIFHDSIYIDLQDKNFTVPYEYFIIKNNIFHKHFYFRRGYIKYIICENNFSVSGLIGSDGSGLKSNSLSVKNNVLRDGWMIWGLSENIAEGIISNNTIIEQTPHSDRDTQGLLLLYNFRGNIQGNVIISYVDNLTNNNGSDASNIELIQLRSNCDVQIFDNMLKKTNNNIRQSIILCSGYSNIIFERNIHNSIRFSPINNSVYGSGLETSFSDYYGAIYDINSVNCDRYTLGKITYEAKTNKLLYAGNKRKSDRILSIVTSNASYNAGKKVMISNTLTYGKSYILIINNSGNDKYYLYFSKYNEEDENFNEDELLCAVGNAYVGISYVFIAPDKNIYPYIYAVSTSETSHTFQIYENCILCEYDGSAYGILRNGTTAQRPSSANAAYIGFKYYDTDLNKEIILAETVGTYIYWREYDGAIAGVKRIGTTAERPTGLYNPSTSNNATYNRSNIYIGFKYIDTDLGKEIYASSIDDNTVTWTEFN